MFVLFLVYIGKYALFKSGKTKCDALIKRNVIFSSKTKCNKIKTHTAQKRSI